MSMLLSMEVRSSMRLRLMLKARMFGMTMAISKMMISRTMRRSEEGIRILFIHLRN